MIWQSLSVIGCGGVLTPLILFERIVIEFWQLTELSQSIPIKNRDVRNLRIAWHELYLIEGVIAVHGFAFPTTLQTVVHL